MDSACSETTTTHRISIAGEGPGEPALSKGPILTTPPRRTNSYQNPLEKHSSNEGKTTRIAPGRRGDLHSSMQGHRDWGRVCRAKDLAEARASRQSGHSLVAALSVGPVGEQEAQLGSAPRRGAAWAWCWRWGKREGIVMAAWPGLGNARSTLGWGEVGVDMMLEVGVHAARGLIMVMFGEGGLGTGKAYLVEER